MEHVKCRCRMTRLMNKYLFVYFKSTGHSTTEGARYLVSINRFHAYIKTGESEPLYHCDNAAHLTLSKTFFSQWLHMLASFLFSRIASYNISRFERQQQLASVGVVGRQCHYL